MSLATKETRVSDLLSRSTAAISTLLLLTLAGCHADVTERLTLNADGSGAVATRILMDDQFAQMATSQGGQDPFSLEKAKRNGWQVAQTIDDAGNHIVTVSQPFSAGNVESTLGATPLGTKVGQQTIHVEQSGNVFVRSYRIKANVPGLLPDDPSKSTNEYAQAGRAMAASIFSMHLVVATPGHVDETNGEVAPDGSVHWSLGLANPTAIVLRVTTINWTAIASAALVVVILIAAAWFARRRTAPTLIAPTTTG